MEAVIRKWGNSLGVRIPSNMAKDISIQDGSSVDIEEQNGQIVIKPINRYVLKDLLDKITKENLHEEVDISDPVGNEIW